MARQGAPLPRPTYVFNAGFLTQKRIRRILTAAGYKPKLGLPGRSDQVMVWGHSRYAHRGAAIAERSGASLIRVEDPLLRSLRTGRSGEPPLGLVVDHSGIYFDATTPSDLETMLRTDPLNDPRLLQRSRQLISRLRAGHLSKYSATDPTLVPPFERFVLVVDQTRNDASIRLGNASGGTFEQALRTAQAEHPGTPIVVKSHPETQAGKRLGHFDADLASADVHLEDRPVSIWRLFENAVAVYCVTSTSGFEAILAGHKPVVFGAPFYAGWGLTDDRGDVPNRRDRRLTAEQLAAATLIKYPLWYDPFRHELCEVETVVDILEAQARAWREDHAGFIAVGMRNWKKTHLRRCFGRYGRLDFTSDAGRALADSRRIMVWAGQERQVLQTIAATKSTPIWRLEDGLLRSRGLGAELVPPLSLVLDDIGIHFDATRASGLEREIAIAAELRLDSLARAEALIRSILANDLTKYNLKAEATFHRPRTSQSVVLVPGQVEDDASLLLGGCADLSNADLLERARAEFPNDFIVFKPHPDVEAGLRPGALPSGVERFADVIARNMSAGKLLNQCDHVMTMTSTMGFEALIRGIPVTTLGIPFYSGWGLTHDLLEQPARRKARPSLAALVHAVLIAYPRYFDPVTQLPCPVEITVERLATGTGAVSPPALRALSKLQGWFAGQSWIWRR